MTSALDEKTLKARLPEDVDVKQALREFRDGKLTIPLNFVATTLWNFNDYIYNTAINITWCKNLIKICHISPL